MAKWLANEWTRVPKEYRPAMVIGKEGAVFDDWKTAHEHLVMICVRRVGRVKDVLIDAEARLNIARSAIDQEA